MSPLLSEVLFVFSNAGALVVVYGMGYHPLHSIHLPVPFLSDPSPIIALPNQSMLVVNYCHLSHLLHGLVKIDTWIFKVVTCIS